MKVCSINDKECKGICPEERVKRNQKTECPIAYWKDPKEDKKRLHEDREFED